MLHLANDPRKPVAVLVRSMLLNATKRNAGFLEISTVLCEHFIRLITKEEIVLCFCTKGRKADSNFRLIFHALDLVTSVATGITNDLHTGLDRSAIGNISFERRL